VRAARSPPPALVFANSSSDEEESDGERTTSDCWEPAPPSPRAEGVAVESTLEVGAKLPVAGSLVEVPAGTAEVPVGTVEVPPSHRGRGIGGSPA
jgi:predicted GNAT family acetyltransferase